MEAIPKKQPAGHIQEPERGAPGKYWPEDIHMQEQQVAIDRKDYNFVLRFL